MGSEAVAEDVWRRVFVNICSCSGPAHSFLQPTWVEMMNEPGQEVSLAFAPS